MKTTPMIAVLVSAAFLAPYVRPAAAQTVLFADDFNRANSNDLDASTNGMSGTLAPLTYLETWQSGKPGNDATLQISNNTLLKANTGGMGAGGLDHNFIDAEILAAGGFSVAFDVAAIGSAADDFPDRYGGFGVGLTRAGIDAFLDENDSDLGPRGTISGVSHGGVADFYVSLSIENKVQVFAGGSLVAEHSVIPTGSKSIRADFSFADFNAGSLVNYVVRFEGNQVASGSFNWSNTGQNHIGFSMRSSTVNLDNLLVEATGFDHSADLLSLTIDPGSLVPVFESNILNYSVTLPFTNSSVTLTPTSVDPSAVIQVIFAGATNLLVSAETSAPLSLAVGANPVVVRVTSATTTLDYSIQFTRVPARSLNVVLILADDMGFSDWGCYGGEIQTPHIDQLAAEGLRFRQFYNGSRCSPTRCSILTGLYPHQAAVDPANALPNLRTDNNVTIAELLQASGYRTYMAGKWHLGGGGRAPEARGFGHVWRFADANAHSADNWNSGLYTLISQNNEITNRTYTPGTFHQTDALGDYSVDFINHHVRQQDGKPFFLYMAFGASHFPLQAPKPLVDQYTPVYAAGWDNIRSGRYNRLQTLGVIDARHLLTPRGGTAPHQSEPIEEIPAWSALTADRRADLARRMAVYAAMSQQLDENVGRVVERLREAGQLDNTLIFVLSDNGGNHEGGRFGQTGGTINATPLTGAALDNMGQSGQPVIYLGGGWANVNDTPFRLFKHSTHEGGIRTPLVVRWPDGITRTNEWEDQPGHLMDIMATIVDVTGVNYPTLFNGHPVLPLEGISLKPAFEGISPVDRMLAFEHESNRALIDGDWKLVTKNFTLYDGSSTADELELYNLNLDPVELTNVAAANPALLLGMVTNWNAWCTRVGLPSSRFLALPLPPPPPAVLKHRWSFNDGTDSIGGAHASLVGTASYGAGQLQIPGGLARSNCAMVNISSTLAANSNLTVEAWFTLNAAQDWAKLWMFGTPNGGVQPGMAYIDFTPRRGANGNVPSINLDTVFGPEVNTAGGGNPAVLSTGTEYHVAAVYDTSVNRMSLYLDGALVDSGSMGAGNVSQLQASEGWFGASVYWPDPNLNGSLNELRIWDNPLTAEQIAANYQLGPDTIPRPSASVTVDNGTIAIAWPEAFPAYGVESSPVLGPGAVWTPLAGTPVLTNGYYVLTASTSNTATFYRLAQ